jgi:TolB protein
MRRFTVSAGLLGVFLTATWSQGAGIGAEVDASAARSDGARKVRVSGLKGSLQNPCWSPDGKRLVITQWTRGYNGGPANVVVVPSSGGGQLARLSETGADSVNMPGSCWNAATNQVAYSADVDGPDAVFLVSPDGNGRRQVVQRPKDVTIEPTISPDGQWVVFESSVFDAEGPASIWKVKSDGTGLTRLTSGANDRQPNWSPAGDKIVFQRERRRHWDLLTIDPHGGSLKNITNTRRRDETDVSWSPDGKRLVYSSDGPTVDIASLYVIGADGSRRRRVTKARRYYDGAPGWSPDGRTIAFESRRGEPDDSPGTRIWTIEAPSP